MAHVLVVGAGPAGAGLAYLLAHRGVQVTLLERQWDFAREFRGEALTPSGLEALAEMGLESQLDAVPSCVQRTADLYMNGKHLVSTDLDPASFRGRVPTIVSQPALLEMMVAEAAKSPSFELVRGASVKDVVVEDGRAVGVRAQTEDGEQLLNADLVVGADGRASAVRKHGGFHLRHADPPMDIVWCKLPCPEEWRGLRGYLGRGHLLVTYRSWDDRLQLAWVILKGTFGALRSRGIEGWVDEMAKHVSPDLACHLRSNMDAIDKPFLLDTSSDCVESWSRPGALLVGDAAHTMSPVAGQGINIALRDAIVAANHLVPVLAGEAVDPPALDAALGAIEAERMEEVATIQRLQAQPPRVILSRAWWGEPVRRIAARLLVRPAIQQRARGTFDTFMFGATEVRLRV